LKKRITILQLYFSNVTFKACVYIHLSPAKIYLYIPVKINNLPDFTQHCF
jgi:hypothetical protein